MDGVANPELDFGKDAVPAYSPEVYPYDDVVLVGASFTETGLIVQGSGAIIGAHTVLTASHVLWDSDLNGGAGAGADKAVAIPEFPDFQTPIGGNYIIHYFQIDDTGDLITASQSQSDFAIIDYATDLSRFGSFGIDTGFTGGTVHLTGYPASADGDQTDQVGIVTKNAAFNVFDYVSVAASAGNSGGPLWVDEGNPGDPMPFVVGVVSTDGHAVALTAGDLQTIQGWEADDAVQFAQLAIGNVLQARTGQTDVEGGSADDTISGWGGGDYLRGNSGDDFIIGGAGFDDINGNKGDDTISGDLTVGSDWLVGGQNNDSITAHVGQNLVYGNLGDDTLQGGAGPDILRGGQGDDVLFAGSGNQFLSGDRGNDTVTAGSGNDTIHSSQDAGIDRILGYNPGHDVVELDPGTQFSVTQVGAHTVITMIGSPGTNEVVLVGVQMSSLTGNWIFGS